MFGSYVKTLRERRGFGLRKFCLQHRLDPSNWSKIEREVLPPPRDRETLRKWAKYLGLAEESQDWRVFFDFAEKDKPDKPAVQQLLKQGTAGTMLLPPPATRPERLPLGDPHFSWVQFEAFARDLIARFEGVVECTHYGKQGSKQKGIDVFAKFSDGRLWAVQCKQVRKFTAGDLKKAITNTSYKASKFTVFVSCEVGSEVRDIVAKKPKWQIWDIRDISQIVRTLDLEVARSLVDRHFGPDWRKLFLGLSPLAPFLIPDRYFEKLLRPDRFFTHHWDLVGRLDVISELQNFAQSTEQVAIMSGRGGIGKSKILQAFSMEAKGENCDRMLWFVEEGIPLTPEVFSELPIRPTLLIVDDAHRRDDLALLLAHAKRLSQVKLLFSSRPQGIDVLQGLLSRSGFDKTEVRILPELKHLDRPNVSALARQALGCDHAHLADQLAAVTRDCPLVTVVGGRLLAQRAINPALLERDEDFRYTVLSRFKDEMLGKVGQENPPFYRSLLEVISATAPFYSDDRKFAELVAASIEKSLDLNERKGAATPERVISAVGQLEKVGLLLRRGRSLRITPDVLADHVLANLCVAANGIPTGIAEILFDHFLEHSPERVLRNLAELDWRIERSSGKGIDLLAKIWTKLEHDFRAGDSHSRLKLLEIVKQAAYFQPAPALRYVRLAYEILQKPDNPNPAEIFPLSNESLLTELPEILQHAAFSMDYLQECCELLWRLGRSDSRQLNPFPNHAIRILQSLAKYEPNKPLSFNVIVLDCLETWLLEPGAFDFTHSPLSILEELLERTGDVSESDGAKLVVSNFFINPQSTRRVRNRAIEILRRAALDAKPKVGISILEIFGSLLHDRFKFGATPNSPKYYTDWLPEKLEALRCIQEIVTHAPSPLVHWKALQILEWPSVEASHPQVREKAKQISGEVPDSFILRLTRALANDTLLSDGLRIRPNDKDFQEQIDAREKLDEEFRAKVCDELTTTFDREGLFARLDRCLRDMDEAGFSSWPNHLLFTFAVRHHDEVVALADSILASPDTPLSRFFHAILGAVGTWSTEAVSALVLRAHALRIPMIERSLAQHFWFSNRKLAPKGTDLDTLIALVCSADSHASRIAIESLRFLAQVDPDLAFELALRVPIEGDESRAEAVCQVFEKAHGISPERLSEGQLQALLSQLDSVPDLNDHWVQEFLSFAAARDPLAVVELFIRRIEHRAVSNNSNFRPIPFHVSVDFRALLSHPSYAQVLRRIRDLTLKASWHFAYFASDLFWSVAQGGMALEVLREWVESKEKDKIAQAAHILESAGNNFVFAHPDLVSLTLEKAAALDEECYRDVFSYLYSSATSGSKSGTPGEPMPRDLEVREKAALLVKRFQTQPKVKAFYESLVKGAEMCIRQDRERFEEMFGAD